MFDALLAIGEREAEEGEGTGGMLKRENVIETVHRYRGGNLLRLALQAIDNVTDFYLDIRGIKRNYLVSSIRFEGTDEERRLLEEIMDGNGGEETPVETVFRRSTRRVLRRAMGEAHKGLDLLVRAGFNLDRSRSVPLIRFMLEVRGVKGLLPLLPKSGKSSAFLWGGDTLPALKVS